MDYKCTEKVRFENLEKNVERNCNDITDLKKDVTLIKISDGSMQVIIKNLEVSLDKIVVSIDKLKWWFLTGLLGPIILAFILAKLSL